MSRGLGTSYAQDFVSATKVTTSTSSSAVVFTPADGVQTSFGYPTALMSDEVLIHNTDATNAVWIRFQTGMNESAAQGIVTAAAGQLGANGPQSSQQFGSAPPSVNSAKFVAATTGTKGEIYIPPATQYTIRVKAFGLTIIAVAGTPIVNIVAVGANNLV